MITGLDHIAIAVEDIEQAIVQWQALTGAKLLHRETVTSQNVHVAMLGIGEFKIELIAPVNADSGVAKFMAARGPGLHHIALRADSTQAELDRLMSVGVRVIDSVARTGAEQTEVGFLHPKSASGVLIEIVEHTHGSRRK